MEGSFYAMDDGLAALLTSAHRALGFFDGMASLVSDKEILADLILFRESYFSKMIDYPDFDSHSMFKEREKSGYNDDIQNILSAYQYAGKTGRENNFL